MADTKISALTAITDLDATDLIPVVDTSATETKKITWANFLADIGQETMTLTNKTFDQDGTGNSITNLADASIKSAAAIAVNKLAALTASEIVITDGSGFISSAAVATYPSLTELTYVKGVTSAIQTQIDTKLANVVEDTTPQLGGTLDGNSNAISGVTTFDSTGAITTTASSGAAVLKAKTTDTIGRLHLDGSSASGDVTQIRLDLDGTAQAYLGTRTTGDFYAYVNGADALTIDTSQNLTIPTGNLTLSAGKVTVTNTDGVMSLNHNDTNSYAFESISTGAVTATVNAVNRFDVRSASTTKNVLQIDNDGQGACLKLDSNNATPGPALYANGGSVVSTAQTATGDGTTTIDWDGGNLFNFQFGAFSETFTFTAPSAPGTFILKLVQDSVGSRTATWPGTVKWPGGAAPTLTTTATTGTDIITFYYDGTSYFAVDTLDFS